MKTDIKRKKLKQELRDIILHWDEGCYYSGEPQPALLKHALEQAVIDLELIIDREAKKGRAYIT